MKIWLYALAGLCVAEGLALLIYHFIFRAVQNINAMLYCDRDRWFQKAQELERLTIQGVSESNRDSNGGSHE